MTDSAVKDFVATLARDSAATFTSPVFKDSRGDRPGVYRVSVDLGSGFQVLVLANSLARLPHVRFAESDMILTARESLIPNDNLWNQLWGR